MDDLSEHLPRTVEQASDLVSAAETVVDTLADRVPHYSWIGIYWVEGHELVLGPWRGPQATEHTRIPVGQGVCGAAAASGEVELVADVSEDARYLECFPSTRSELVVPIHAPDGSVVGEIDVDSDRIAAFDDDDVHLLRAVASALGARSAG